MVGLEAEATSTRIRVAVLSHHFPVEEIPGIELHARFRGGHVEGAPGRWLDDVGSVNERRASLRTVQHKGVVVPVSVGQLWVRLIDSRSYRRGLRKSNGVPATDGRSPVGMDV